MAASFIGTKEEFMRYIGPRLRNLVQTTTKSYKQGKGKCEHCHSIKEVLQSAHRHGKSREDLINKCLLGSTNSKGLIRINDLTLIENNFKKLHEPIEEIIIVLCKDCHNKYDSKTKSGFINGKNLMLKGKTQKKVLPIKLVPENPHAFKQNILRTKKAKITIHFNSGEKIIEEWKTPKLSMQSNIMGNLRSKPQFRQGSWQKNGISHVIVNSK